MRQKTVQATVLKSDNSDYDGRFILSAASPDRMRDTIDPAIYDTIANTTEKLIALFNHDPNRPVGFWEKFKREKDTLTAYIKFAGTNLGEMLKQLIGDGVPLGASIGFRGSGEPNELGGILWNALELIETSIVATPAHPRAVQLAKQYGITWPINGPHTTATSGDQHQEKRIRANRAIVNARRVLKDVKT